MVLFCGATEMRPAMNQLLMSLWSQIKAYLYIIVCISHPSYYAVYRPWWSVIFRILSSLRLSFEGHRLMLCALYTGALEVTTSYNYILVKCLIVNLLKELYLSRKWGRSYAASRPSYK